MHFFLDAPVGFQWCTVKPVFFACPLFHEFREPGKFAKITGCENFNTVAFQCNRKQKRQNYGVQNNYIDSNAKIKGSTVVDYIIWQHQQPQVL